MPADDPRARYLALAQAHYERQSDPSDLASQRHSLPPLTPTLYDQLQRDISEMARHTPRHAWTLAKVVEEAATAQDDPRLQALAAFHVARAANVWVQPQRVWRAAQRARKRFAQLGESGWVAACHWQEYALPWATNDFQHAAHVLQQALAGMDAPEVVHWQVDCCLSLAFAHILLTDFDAAMLLLARCEEECRAIGDALRLAQTLNHKAACLRRVWRFEESIAAASEAAQLLAPLTWPLEQARTQFQLGNALLLQGADYERATTTLQSALQTFEGAEVDLWTAQCHFTLARIYRETGRLAPAGDALQQARRIFSRYPIKGLLADALLDSAIFALRTGRPQRALSFLDEAEPLYAQLQVEHLAALCSLYRGETYAEMDRFQLALHYMERAYNRLHELNVADRIAEAALRLGEVWLWLDRPATALSYLQEATDFYEKTSHTSFLAELYSLLTAARLRNRTDVSPDRGDLSDVVEAASAALRRLEPHGVHPYLALLQRFLGEAYLASDQPRQALEQLQAAVARFESMAMELEVAECCLPLGRCYLALSQPQEAARAWQRSLNLSQQALPAIAWPAHDGLAQLSAAEGEVQQALAHYRRMVAAFGRLRRGFWQPSLAGTYLHRSAQALDRAVELAAQHQSPHLLQFVEESKAQTMTGRLHRRITSHLTAQQRELATEIRWLQQQIGAARQLGVPAASWLQLQNELVASVQRYETVAARSERQTTSVAGDGPPHEGFDEDAFRRAASESFGERWLALDYYLTESTLVCLLLSPRERRAHVLPLSTAARRALDVATRPAPVAPPPELAMLARWLLPATLSDRLTPATALIISPHRGLHRLPWAALPLNGSGGAPLAAQCAPLLAPSLHSFTLLAQRDMPRPERRAGCVVAVSDFGGRRPPLPAVPGEAAALVALMDPSGSLLPDAQANWDALRDLSRPSGLAAHAFLHIASHAFFDAVTGRASGLALYDRDVWLDELWELAPLPPLVSLSACSSMQSYLYEGDEHISLPATCLQAGARQVVGSLWKVRDEDAPRVTTAFYDHFLSGAHPALALARAQRQVIAAGAPWGAWAPYICVGAG